MATLGGEGGGVDDASIKLKLPFLATLRPSAHQEEGEEVERRKGEESFRALVVETATARRSGRNPSSSSPVALS